MDDIGKISIDLFNRRDERAFIKIYENLYKELCHFASSLYRDGDMTAQDVVHDLFVNLWTSKNIKFQTEENLKAYLYVSIKNGFKNYIKHQNHVHKYQNVVSCEEDYFVTKMVETETYSVLSQAVNILPEECARIFKMTLNGWSTDEIADKLGKSKSTIYEHKQNAVKIIKKNLFRNFQ